MRQTVISVCALLLLSMQGYAARKEPFFLRDAVGVKSYPAAPRLAERAAMVPASMLPPAESTVPEEIVAIREWNASGREPMRNGFKRTLPDVIELNGNAYAAAKSGVSGADASAPIRAGRGVSAQSDHGTTIWSTVVQVEKAHRLRLHLENCVIPDGAVLWVYGQGETPIGFGRELLDDKGGLWTPSTHGDTVWLDVEMPAGAPVSFTLREVLELVDVNAAAVNPEDSPTCLIDSVCVTSATFDAIANVHRAIAHLEFVTSGGGAVCSGGLLNDRSSSGTPYLLTANHCFSDQTTASSVDAYFDFTTTSCNGSFNGSTAPHTHGATLLASSMTSDFTLIKLNSIPSGRYFLGWDTTPPSAGTLLHRVSHPVPATTIFPQMYSNTNVNASVPMCTFAGGAVAARPNFIYSSANQGGIYGGSSGSPSILAGGYVVGQLLGTCPTSSAVDPKAGCDPGNSIVDGAFSTTYNTIAQFIDPSGASPVCTANATTLCLSDSRFAVTATYQAGTNSGNGQAVRLTADTGYFWFFGPDNVEVVIKVLNACGLNSKFWVFSGGLTNVQVTITVRDTKTGTVRTYANPANTAFQPIQDTGAFATCP